MSERLRTGQLYARRRSRLIGGTDDQKRRFFDVLNKGGLGASGLTEPGAGSDAAALSMTAKLDVDAYILNGTKQFITNGGVADYYTVFATTDKKLKHRGIVAFMVDRQSQGIRHRKEGEQARHPHVRHLAGRLRGRPRARRESPLERGRGLQALHDDPRHVPADDRGPRRRQRPGRLRLRPALRQGPRGLRQAYRHPAGHPVHARRHGHGDRGGAPSHSGRPAG